MDDFAQSYAYFRRLTITELYDVVDTLRAAGSKPGVPYNERQEMRMDQARAQRVLDEKLVEEETYGGAAL
jgi:hypothetical protein